jgi:hypothetical protein
MSDLGNQVRYKCNHFNHTMDAQQQLCYVVYLVCCTDWMQLLSSVVVWWQVKGSSSSCEEGEGDHDGDCTAPGNRYIFSLALSI